MFLIRKKADDNNVGVIYILCQPPYNSNFLYFKIKSLVPACSTSNLRDSTVYGLVSAYSLFDVAVPV